MVEANHLRNFITDLTIFKATEHFHLIHKKGKKWGRQRGGSQQSRTSLGPSERQKGDGNRLVEQEQNNRKEEKQEGTE